MRYLLIVLVVALAVDTAVGLCGICGSSSGVACRDSKTFSFCDGGKVESAKHFCPIGTTCGDDRSICSVAPKNPCDPVCGKCTTRFACVSENTYALCFGQALPTGQTHQCPEGEVCSTQMATPSGLEFCFSPTSLTTEKIDCYKDIVINVPSNNDGGLLIPRPSPQGNIEDL